MRIDTQELGKAFLNQLNDVLDISPNFVTTKRIEKIKSMVAMIEIADPHALIMLVRLARGINESKLFNQDTSKTTAELRIFLTKYPLNDNTSADQSEIKKISVKINTYPLEVVMREATLKVLRELKPTMNGPSFRELNIQTLLQINSEAMRAASSFISLCVENHHSQTEIPSGLFYEARSNALTQYFKDYTEQLNQRLFGRQQCNNTRNEPFYDRDSPRNA